MYKTNALRLRNLLHCSTSWTFMHAGLVDRCDRQKRNASLNQISWSVARSGLCSGLATVLSPLLSSVYVMETLLPTPAPPCSLHCTPLRAGSQRFHTSLLRRRRALAAARVADPTPAQPSEPGQPSQTQCDHLTDAALPVQLHRRTLLTGARCPSPSCKLHNSQSTIRNCTKSPFQRQRRGTCRVRCTAAAAAVYLSSLRRCGRRI